MSCVRLPTEKILEMMVTEEDEIRHSKEYQDQCTAVKNIPNGWLTVTSDIQKSIINKHGFTDDISADIALNMMRSAVHLYPNNPIFQNVLYVKHNLAKKGTLKIGDNISNYDIIDINNQSHSLYDLVAIEKPSILLMGSHT